MYIEFIVQDTNCPRKRDSHTMAHISEESFLDWNGEGD